MNPSALLEADILGLGVLDLALLLLAMTLIPAIWRASTGPSDPDRAIGADHVFYVFLASLALIALRFERPMLLDLLLVGILIGFISAVVLARFVGRSQK